MADDRQWLTGFEWAEYLGNADFRARSMLTLTWRGEGVSVDQALWWWSKLVAVLNETMGGNSYTKRWGHSYFSYVVGVERTRAGVVHLHSVVDEPVAFTVVHSWWEQHCGFAWISAAKSSGDDQQLRYVLKYATKDGDLTDRRQMFLRGFEAGGRVVHIRPGDTNAIARRCGLLAAAHRYKKASVTRQGGAGDRTAVK